MSKLVVICSIVLTSLAPVTSHAQHVRGNLEGRVVDVSGTPLPDVNITVSGNDVQGIRGATTNARGFFRVLALPVGNRYRRY